MSDPGRVQSESGSVLIVMMVGLTAAMIALGAAVQLWSTTWRRDNEEELIFRANQYVDGIVAYRKEHGGQFPLNLEDLYKPGPRRMRYIRRLYKDPIAKDGKWGLLYLMPGGQGVYDPKAAQKAQEKNKNEWGGWETAGTNNPANASGAMPGVTAINQNWNGTGVPGTGGAPAGAPPMPAIQGGMPPIPDASPVNPGDAEPVSEPPIGWPIVGVISRATGKLAKDTYRIYKGHEHVDEWQFHVFDRGEQVQTPGNPLQLPTGNLGQGPGYGGVYKGGPVVDPNMNRGGMMNRLGNRGPMGTMGNQNLYPRQGGRGGGQGGPGGQYNPQNPYGQGYDPRNPYGNQGYDPRNPYGQGAPVVGGQNSNDPNQPQNP